ncbi:hypothetical protein TNCV_1001541 [Trichonephila clavipes]|nr:hypothetical protein TNCV_1001541 [Trichonephila clavipes]
MGKLVNSLQPSLFQEQKLESNRTMCSENNNNDVTSIRLTRHSFAYLLPANQDASRCQPIRKLALPTQSSYISQASLDLVRNGTEGRSAIHVLLTFSICINLLCLKVLSERMKKLVEGVVSSSTVPHHLTMVENYEVRHQ